MAPSIYEWQGITLRFFSNDHEPIHVHAFYGEEATIFELYIEDGKVVNIVERTMTGRESLPAAKKKLALRLVRKYKYEIINNWTKFFILHEKVKFKRIRGKYL